MGLSTLQPFAALSRMMGRRSDRQKTLPDDIASAGTPYRQAGGLRPLDLKQELTRAAGSRHISETPSSGADPEPAPLGNPAPLADERTELSQTAADHRLMTDLYKKRIDLTKDPNRAPG